MIALGVAALLASQAATGVQAPTTLSPVQLFQSVCGAGSGRVAKALLTPISYDMLPAGAHRTLMYSFTSPANRAPEVKVGVPNPVFRVTGDSEAFLMVTAPEAIADSLTADSCAVVWHREEFDIARKAVFPRLSSPGPRTTTSSGEKQGVGFISVTDGDRATTIAAKDGWTVMRSVRRRRN